MKKTLHIALIQSDPAWGKVRENLDAYSSMISKAGQIDLVLLPEMFTTGFMMDPVTYSEEDQELSLNWMKKLSGEGDFAMAGSMIFKENSRFHNTVVFIKPGGEPEFYHKRHLFRMSGEEMHFTPGKSRLIVNFRGWRICPLICYDLRFPVWSRNRNDYDLLVYHSNWPEPRNEVWEILLKARAIENQAYVAGVNRCGSDGNGIQYIGNSLIFGPKGEKLANAPVKRPGIIHAEISLDELLAFRKKFPVMMDADDFQLKS